MASTYIEPVYWNVENPRFVQNYTRHVKLQQKMDIFCPRKMLNWHSLIDESESVTHHYQTIYMVDSEGFDKCKVDLKSARKLMTCKTPEIEKKFTFIFQEVNPNPFGFEFEPNRDYYLISTSSGEDEDGLANIEKGVCESSQMKMSLQVHPGDENDGVQKMGSRIEEILFESQIGGSSRREEIEMETENSTDVVIFNNFLIIGIVLGIILVLMIIMVGFLTRRSFQQKRKHLSYPTLSDYQSSYVESCDYPPQPNYHPTYSNQENQTVDLKTPPPNYQPVSQPAVNYQPVQLPAANQPNCDIIKPTLLKQKRETKEEFSYIDGRYLNRSNRTNDVIVI